MHQGEDADFFICQMEKNLWMLLKDKGEVISNERFAGIILQTTTNDYELVR